MNEKMTWLDRLVLWYLSTRGKCFVQNTMYGPKVTLNLHCDGPNTILIDYSKEVYDKYGVIREAEKMNV